MWGLFFIAFAQGLILGLIQATFRAYSAYL